MADGTLTGSQSKTNRLMLFVFPLGHMINDWPGAALWILAPAIAVAMDLSAVEVGLLITIHSAVASLAYFPAGIVGDFVKKRGTLLAITFWWVAIGYFLAASAPNFWILALLLGLGGLGDAAWHPIATGTLVEQMPQRRAHVLGIHALGGTLAEVGAPICAGLLLGFFSWQTVLQISSIPALIMGIFFLRFRHAIPDLREASVTRDDLRGMVDIWIRPKGIRVIAIIVFYNMSLMGAMAMMPLHMKNTYSLSLAQTGFMFAAIWGVGALIQPLVGHISDVIGRKVISIIGLCLAAVFMAAVAMSTTFMWTAAFAIMGGSALVGLRAVLLAAMVDVAGKRETTTLGFAFAVMDGVGALGALLAGLAGQQDLHYAFAFAALAAGVSMVQILLACQSS